MQRRPGATISEWVHGGTAGCCFGRNCSDRENFEWKGLSDIAQQGLISYKDLSQEIVNVLKSKKDEIIFKLDLSTKEELEILKKRVDLLEKKIKEKKSKKVKKS